MKAILLSDQGWTHQESGEALFLDEETINRPLQEYRESRKLFIQTGGSSSQLNTARTLEWITHLEQQVDLKVSDIGAYVQTTYGIADMVFGITSWFKTPWIFL